MTRQPLLSPVSAPSGPQQPDWQPLHLLSALGNQAIASMLPSGGDAPASFGWSGGASQPTPTTAPTASLASESAQLALDLGQAPRYYANSPLVGNLMKMDPEAAIAASGLSPELWTEAWSALSSQKAQSWTEIEQRLGGEAASALMNASAQNLVSQHTNEYGLTNLYMEMLNPMVRGNPDTTNIQKAMTDNFGDSVTKVFNPTLDEAKAIFDTNQIQNATVAAHGYPKHIDARVGDSWDFAYQDSEEFATAAGQSEELRAMLLINCYGALGGPKSTGGTIAANGATTMASHPILFGNEADQLASSSMAALAAGADPKSAFIKAGQDWTTAAATRDPWVARRKISAAETVQDYANRGKSFHGSDPELVKETIEAAKQNGPVPELSVYEGSRNNKPLPEIKEPTPVEVRPLEGGEQLTLPGFDSPSTAPPRQTTPPLATSSPEIAPTTPELPLNTPEIAPSVSDPASSGSFGPAVEEAEDLAESAAKGAGKFNLLEGGLHTLGLLGGGLQTLGGAKAIGDAWGGAVDQREGVVGGANVLSGLTGVLQSGVSIAEKIPQLAPALEAAPWLRAVPGMKALGMLSALPAVAGWGYDVATGKDGSVTALSGGNAVEALGSAAASTFGGGIGMAASLGASAGEGVFNTFVEHADNAPKSLGELSGMVDYSIDQVGEDVFFRDTVAEMAFDSRLEDPDASKQSKDWAYASASMARLYLMADQGVHDLFGTGDQSMLHQILDPKAAKPAATTPSAALTGGD